MKNLLTPGRFLFAVAITAFGIQHFIFAITGAGIGPPWTPLYHLLAYLLGILLIAAGVGLMTGIQVRCAGIAIAIVVVARVVLGELPKFAANVRNPGPWTSAFELLALGGASLVLAAAWEKAVMEAGAAGRGFTWGELCLAHRSLCLVSST